MFQQWSVVNVPQSELPAFLRKQIDDRGWDDSMLARKAGINKSTLSKLINDASIVPELTTLEKLSRALSVSLVTMMVAAGYDPGELETSVDMSQLAILLEAVPELKDLARSVAKFSPDERRALMAYIQLVQSQRS